MSEGGPKTKQIRPRVRKKQAAPAPSTPTTKDNAGDQDVEETRQRLESWMGLGTSSEKKSVPDKFPIPTPAPSTQTQETAVAINQAPTAKTTKSILKTPKYTKKTPVSNAETSSVHRFTPNDDRASATEATNDHPAEDLAQNPVICKSVIQERDPTKPMLKRKVKNRKAQMNHAAVEGYVPASAATTGGPPLPAASNTSATVTFDSVAASTNLPTTQKKDDSNAATNPSDPLILNSLEQLFEAAGENLPSQHDPNRITADTQLLEADIAFSVMSPDQYQGKLSEIRQEHEEDRQAQLRVFMGKEDAFGDGSSGPEDEDEEDDDIDDDDDLMEMLMEGDMDDDDDMQEEEREPRAFRLLWDTLLEWITPEAVQYVAYLISSAKADGDVSAWTTPLIERSDVEASRCAGLMAMIKLYLPKCLDEVGIEAHERRKADTRLGELLRAFNYSKEAPKLPVKLWKVMTCILLDIVFVERRITKSDGESTPTQEGRSLPVSVQATDMTWDEYHYLTTSSIQTFIN